MLLDVLLEFHSPDLAIVKDKAITSSNEYLIASLLSTSFIVACVLIRASRSLKHARFLEHAFSFWYAVHICMARWVPRLAKLMFSQHLRTSKGLVLWNIQMDYNCLRSVVKLIIIFSHGRLQFIEQARGGFYERRRWGLEHPYFRRCMPAAPP